MTGLAAPVSYISRISLLILVRGFYYAYILLTCLGTEPEKWKNGNKQTNHVLI